MDSLRAEQSDGGSEAATRSHRAGNAITARSVIIGILSGVLICIIQIAYKINSRTVVLPLQSTGTLLTGPVFTLFLLALANVGIRRFRPASAFRPVEFAVVYGLSTVAAAIAAQDQLMQLWPMMVFPFRANQVETAALLKPNIPTWMVPQDPRIVEPYYMGGVSFWTWERISAFLVPAVAWLSWLAALGATMWAWNVILRKRWMDHDRLAFPCVQVPMEICRSAGFGGQVSGKLFWGGFIASFIVETLFVLNQRFPAIPAIPLTFNASAFLQDAPTPWNGLYPMTMFWSTVVLGVCYLIPMDILLSGSVFYLARKGLEVVGFAAGWREFGWDMTGFPYTRSQAAGAWFALFFLLVWAERRQIASVLQLAFSRSSPGPTDDANEPGSYRTAGRMLVGGTLFLLMFSVYSGMSVGVAVVYYAFFWMLNITMTRIYAQVGPPLLELYFLDPQKTLTTIFGTRGFSPRSLTIFSLMYWWNRVDRGQPQAHQLSAFYVAHHSGANMRRYGAWVLVAFGVGCVTCLVAYLHYAYKIGEDQFESGGWRETFSAVAVSRVNEWVTTPRGPNWTEIGFMAGGGVFTLALAKLSYTFVGFPLHPIGFALAMCYALEYTWPAFLGVWFIKGWLLRYGGRALYLRYIPVSFGLVLGGIVVPILWGFVAWAFEWYR